MLTAVVPATALVTAVDSANNAVGISPPQLLSDFRVHMNIKIKLYICVCCVENCLSSPSIKGP